MPRSALSGSHRMQGHKKVFWGRDECFSAPVGKYMQYMQIVNAYMHIHAHTCNTYTYIIAHSYICQKTVGRAAAKQLHADTCRYMQIHAHN